MTVSISGNTWHVHALCDTCGRPTRYKQWPIRCQCPTMSAGRSTSPLVAEIQVEQEQKNVELRARVATFSDTGLRVASRYADGRKKRGKSV